MEPGPCSPTPGRGLVIPAPATVRTRPSRIPPLFALSTVHPLTSAARLRGHGVTRSPSGASPASRGPDRVCEQARTTGTDPTHPVPDIDLGRTRASSSPDSASDRSSDAELGPDTSKLASDVPRSDPGTGPRGKLAGTRASPRPVSIPPQPDPVSMPHRDASKPASAISTPYPVPTPSVMPFRKCRARTDRPGFSTPRVRVPSPYISTPP